MIVTVTMNPALDKTATVRTLLPGALNRLSDVRTDAGGKGVNVSKMIHVLGGRSVCTGFVGGDAGRELCRRLTEAGLENDFLPADGTTRTNLKIMDSARGLTELNEPGIFVRGEELDALLQKVLALAGPGGTVVLGGSLPQGAPPTTYLSFARALRQASCTVILDADGPAFKLAMEAPPHIIKPNRFELLQYCDLPESTPDEALPGLCRSLLAAGVEFVILSMGGDGAMFFTREQQAKAAALPVEVRSTVGAGDSMVGAVAYARAQGLGFEDTVRLAMACSIGAVTTPGTNPPAPELIGQLKQQIRLQPV